MEKEPKEKGISQCPGDPNEKQSFSGLIFFKKNHFGGATNLPLDLGKGGTS